MAIMCKMHGAILTTGSNVHWGNNKENVEIKAIVSIHWDYWSSVNDGASKLDGEFGDGFWELLGLEY